MFCYASSGNDLRAREVANSLWVDGPAETEYLLSLLINDLRTATSGTRAPVISTVAVPLRLPVMSNDVPAPGAHAPESRQGIVPLPISPVSNLSVSPVSSPVDRGISSSSGLSAGHREMVLDSIRSQWVASGGVVVGEVVRGTPKGESATQGIE